MARNFTRTDPVSLFEEILQPFKGNMGMTLGCGRLVLGITLLQ